jgi:hypothetical protein
MHGPWQMARWGQDPWELKHFPNWGLLAGVNYMIGGQYVGTKWGISGPGIRHLFYFLLSLF